MIFFVSGVTLLGKAGNPKVKIEVRGLGYVFLAHVIVRYYHFASVIHLLVFTFQSSFLAKHWNQSE